MIKKFIIYLYDRYVGVIYIPALKRSLSVEVIETKEFIKLISRGGTDKWGKWRNYEEKYIWK